METKDSIYYRGNRDHPQVTLETEYKGIKSSIELPWDVSGYDLIHALYTLLTLHFDSDLILDCFKAYAEKKDMEPLRLWDDFTISLKSEDLVMTVQLDHSNMIDLLKAFHSITIGMTFHKDCMYDMLKDYVDELRPEEINYKEE